MFEHWIVCTCDGVDTYTPIEINERGELTEIVYGMALVGFKQEDIVKRGAKTILRVEDEYDLSQGVGDFEYKDERWLKKFKDKEPQ